MRELAAGSGGRAVHGAQDDGSREALLKTQRQTAGAERPALLRCDLTGDWAAGAFLAPFAELHDLLLLDKGTLDALEGEEDKMSFVRNCHALLRKNAHRAPSADERLAGGARCGGQPVLVSVSFLSALRYKFWRRVQAEGLFDFVDMHVVLRGETKACEIRAKLDTRVSDLRVSNY